MWNRLNDFLVAPAPVWLVLLIVFLFGLLIGFIAKLGRNRINGRVDTLFREVKRVDLEVRELESFDREIRELERLDRDARKPSRRSFD